MVVFPDRLDQGRPRIAADVSHAGEPVKPLAQVPAVVPATDDNVDLFPGVLPDIARPEVASLSVEGDPPDVADSPGSYFAAGVLAVGKGIVLGNGVLEARVLVIDVD